MTSYIAVVVLVAVSLGIVGYLAFGSKSSSIILSNMPKTAAAGVIARVAYLFAIIGVWVIILQPVFYVIESSTWYAAFAAEPDLEDQETDTEPSEGTTTTPFNFYLVRTIIVAIIVLGSFAMPNLNLTLSLGGAFIGFFITILMPVMFYNKAYQPENVQESVSLIKAYQQDPRGRIKLANLIILLLASLVSLLGLVEAIKLL